MDEGDEKPRDRRFDDALKALVDTLSEGEKKLDTQEPGAPPAAQEPGPLAAPAKPAVAAAQPEKKEEVAARLRDLRAARDRLAEAKGEQKMPLAESMRGVEYLKEAPEKGKAGTYVFLRNAVAIAALVSVLVCAYFVFIYLTTPVAPPGPGIQCNFTSTELACNEIVLDNESFFLDFSATQMKEEQIEVYAISCDTGELAQQELASPVAMQRGIATKIAGEGTANAAYCPGPSGESFERSLCLYYTTVILEQETQDAVCGEIMGSFGVREHRNNTPQCTASCPDGSNCSSDGMCQSGYCAPGSRLCAACSHNCAQGVPCTDGAACASGICSEGKCTCSSGCGIGELCLNGSSCSSGRCSNGFCASPLELSISACTTIYEAGSYELEADTSSPDTCFIIYADNVALDCNGHTVSGANKGTGFIVGGNNVTLKDCRIEWFEKGVSTGVQNSGLSVAGSRFYRNTAVALELGAANSSVIGCTFTENWESLIILAGANGSTIGGNLFNSSNGDAIRADLSQLGEKLSIVNNTVRGAGGVGMLLRNMAEGDVTGNEVEGNSGNGIMLSGGSKVSRVMNNHAARNGGTGILLTSGQNSVTGNVAEGNGVDGISSNGAVNEFENNIACSNEGNDMACPLGGGIGDSGGNACTAKACSGLYCLPCPLISTCTVIDKPGAYRAYSDLQARGGDCITITSGGVALDCNGHAAMGTGMGNGISVLNANGVNITNCSTTGFYNGFYWLNSRGTMANSSARNNTGDGVLIENPVEVNASFCDFSQNMAHGIAFIGSGYSSIRSTTVQGNSADGISSPFGYRALENVTAAGNGARGVYFGQSSGVIQSSAICGNGAQFQAYCDAAASGIDGGNNSCGALHRCELMCRRCP